MRALKRALGLFFGILAFTMTCRSDGSHAELRHKANSSEPCGNHYYEGGQPGEGDHVNLGVLADELEIEIGVLRPVDGPVYIYLVHRGTCRVLRKVETPLDLSGYVSIETPEDCLEYLRFFSLPSTHALTGGDYVEIFPYSQNAPAAQCWNLVKETAWQKYSIPSPRVYPSKVELPCGKAGMGAAVGGGFRCVRSVLYPSNEVFLVTEDVLPDGRWALVEKERLGVTAEELGILFMLH